MGDKKVILFNPFPKQQEFIEAAFQDEYSFILYGGAVRGGKTFSILGLFILCAKLFPGSKYVVCRKTIDILKATTLKSFNEIVPRSFTAKMPSQSNGWEWVATNGSVIKFFGENIDRDPDLFRFRGLEYDSIAFDELDVTEDTWRKAFERVGTWKMDDRMQEMSEGKPIPPRKVFGTSNPQDGWVKSVLYDVWKEGKLNPKWIYINSRVYDNPHVPAEWIQNQRENMLPEDFEKFIEGDWEVDKNKVRYFTYYDDKIHYNPKAEFEFDPYAKTVLAFDFNYDPTTCTVYQVHEDRGVIGMREFAVTGGTRILCEAIQESDVMKVPTWLWTVTGDSSGMSKSSTAGDVTDYDIIQEVFGLEWSQFINVHSRNKALTYSRKLCDTFLYKVPFLMDSRMKLLRRDLMIAKPDKNGQLYKNRDLGYDMDLLDTFRYFVDCEFPNGKDDIDSFVNLIEANQSMAS